MTKIKRVCVELVPRLLHGFDPYLVLKKSMLGVFFEDHIHYFPL